MGRSKLKLRRHGVGGKDTILEIEVKGALQIRAQNLEPARALLLWLLPPSFGLLEERLRLRNTESESELAQRLDIAKSELTHIQDYDYCIINPDDAVEKVVRQIQAVITAERSRIDSELTRVVHERFGVVLSES